MFLFFVVSYGAGYEHALSLYKQGNFVAAFNELIVLAEQGDADAQFNLGFMYYQGEGVAQDYKKAIEWYQKAAEQNYPGAQEKVAELTSRQ